MSDQAENLRMKLMSQQQQAKTIAVISGKGGVGKSNFSLNFSISLSKQGYRVLLFDMDIGMGNIDILMGMTSKHSIVDFFERDMPLKDIVEKGPENVSIIAGGTGLFNLFELEEKMFERFLSQFNEFLSSYDYIIFDMGAGISEVSSKFILSAEELIIITTPEPTSVMDAYSIMKYLAMQNSSIPFFLVCNRVHLEKEGTETIKRLSNAMMKFLEKEIKPLGYLPDDRLVSKAVSRQVPFLLFDPSAEISRALDTLTDRYTNSSFNQELSFRKNNFLGKLKNYFLGR